MKVDILNWYKHKVKYMSGYIGEVYIRLVKDDNCDDKDLKWLLNEYTPQKYDTLYTDDQVLFANDGTEIHNITIIIKEISEDEESK